MGKNIKLPDFWDPLQTTYRWTPKGVKESERGQKRVEKFPEMSSEKFWKFPGPSNWTWKFSNPG